MSSISTKYPKFRRNHTYFSHRDESDETGCQMMVMKENYNKKIAPFVFDYESRTVIPVNVNISMAVMDIVSISEIDLEYVLKFRFLMIWYDYRCGLYFYKYSSIHSYAFLLRLLYHNLKDQRSLNSLSREEIDRVFSLIFLQKQKGEQ